MRLYQLLGAILVFLWVLSDPLSGLCVLGGLAMIGFFSCEGHDDDDDHGPHCYP